MYSVIHFPFGAAGREEPDLLGSCIIMLPGSFLQAPAGGPNTVAVATRVIIIHILFPRALLCCLPPVLSGRGVLRFLQCARALAPRIAESGTVADFRNQMDVMAVDADLWPTKSLPTPPEGLEGRRWGYCHTGRARAHIDQRLLTPRPRRTC